MSKNFYQTHRLNAGKFYGQVPSQRTISTAILSEVVHKNKLNLREHSHELAYFSLVLDGGYTHQYAREVHLYQPMSIIWHRDGILHKDEIGENGLRFFTIEVQPKSLESLNQFAGVPKDFFDQSCALVWLAGRLFYEFKNWQVGSELIAEGITLEMLAHVARKYVYMEKHPPVWLLRVVEKLNDQYAENFSNEELAMEANVHPVHLATVFRQFYGETISEYAQKIRLNLASRLLLDKKLPIAEIACLCGFSDQSHFTRVFKRFVGVTPGAFRNSID